MSLRRKARIYEGKNISTAFLSNNNLLLVVNIGHQLKANIRDEEFRLITSAPHGCYHDFENHNALQIRSDAESLLGLLYGNIKHFILLTE